MATPTTGLEKIKLSEKLYTIPEKKGILRSLIIFLRIFLVSIQQFMKNDGLTKASAIAYTNIVSLVPVLTVALALLTVTSGFKDKEDELFDQLNTFLLKNEIKMDITPYLETLKDIINSATQIGTVGFVVLIFSATAILRTLEAAFNQIWKIETPRPMAQKIIFYFFILAIGPMLGAVIYSFAFKFADAMRASHLYSVTRSSDNFLWIGGENGTLIKIDEKGKKLARLKDFKIDYENMYCISLTRDPEVTCDKPKLNKETFIKVRNRKQQLIAISTDGIILESTDLGKTWKLTEFVGVKFVDFSIADENNLFLVTQKGEAINYHGKDKFERLPFNYYNSNEDVVLTRVRFPDPKNGCYLDAKGYIWFTSDGGKSFNPKKVTNAPLNDLAYLDLKNIVVVADKGGIFSTTDGGNTWTDFSHRKISYTKVWNLQNEGRTELVVLNEAGMILYSYDMADNWQVSYAPQYGKLNAMIPINPKFGFAALNPEDEGEETQAEESKTVKEPVSPPANQSPGDAAGDILAVGEFGIISIGDFKNNQLVWHTISGGENAFSIYSIINMLIPLSAIWLFFLILYMLIPNTRVPFKPAAIGAALTGTILLLFLWSFLIYLKSFATSTMLIYRALAAVPIFLLIVYCLSIICLFGAEITATLQYKDRYLSSKNPFAEDDEEGKYTFYNVIKLLVIVYNYQLSHRKLIPQSVLKHKLNVAPGEYEALLSELSNQEFLVKTEEETISPCRVATDLDLYEIYEKIIKEKVSLPENTTGEKFSIKVKDTFVLVHNYSKETLTKIKLSDLVVQNGRI